MLLGFWTVDTGGAGSEEDAADAPDNDTVPEREALVVGTSLVQLGDAGLGSALAASRPPPATPQASPAERPARPRRRGRGRR